jgi:hypothetical protein
LNPILLIPHRIEFHLPHDIKPSIPEINSLEDFHVSNPFRNAGEKLEIDTEVYRGKLIGIDVPDTIPNAGHIIPQIALEEKRPISPTLERIENFVSLIIKDFKERLFL